MIWTFTLEALPISKLKAARMNAEGLSRSVDKLQYNKTILKNYTQCTGVSLSAFLHYVFMLAIKLENLPNIRDINKFWRNRIDIQIRDHKILIYSRQSRQSCMTFSTWILGLITRLCLELRMAFCLVNHLKYISSTVNFCLSHSPASCFEVEIVLTLLAKGDVVLQFRRVKQNARFRLLYLSRHWASCL